MHFKTQYILLARILVYCYAVNVFSHISSDFDLWGHIKFGEDIWQAKSILATDPYNYVVPNHAWYNHEWLTEVLFFLLYAAFDSTGILLLKLGIGLTIIHLLSQLYFSWSKNIPVYCLFFTLWTHVVALGFTNRPHLLTFLFLTLLLVILYRYSDGQRMTILWVPPLIALWVNCHGGFLAGFGIFGMFVLVESLTQWRKKEKPDPLLLYALMGAFLALLVNPYGYHLLSFLSETVPRQRNIKEWWPIPLWSTDYIHYKIMVLLFLASLLSPLRKRPWELAIILFSIFYGFKHLRHSVLAGIVMTPIAAAGFAAMIDPWIASQKNRAWPRWSHVAILVCMGLFSIFQLSHNFLKWHKFGYKVYVSPTDNPVYAVRFLKENDINGNIMTNHNWGEYVIWKMPESKVAIDGRFWTVYPPDTIIQNAIFHYGWKGWEHYLDLYPHDIILTLLDNKGIETHPGWVKIYQDMNSRIFVRKTDPPNPVHQKFLDHTLTLNDTPASHTFP